MKCQWNIGKKPAGFILGVPQHLQMLKPFLNGFDMTVKHGGVGIESEPVSCLGNFQPAGTGQLLLTG